MSTSATSTRSTRTRSARRLRASRWLAVFVAVTALHWLAAGWFERHRGPTSPVATLHVPVQIELLTPQRIEREARPAAPPAAAKSKPAARAPKPEPHTLRAVAPPRPHPTVPAAAQPASTPASEAATASAASAASAAANAAPTGASGAAQTPTGNGKQPSAQAADASHGVKFSIPPSGELQYDTFYNGVRNQPGTIHWTSDGQRYEMVVAVPLPFIGTFTWTSRGRVDAFGLAPDQYIEKRGHRPEDVTVFNRTDRQIVFTRTPASLALPDGAQDRFSMVMQLASLVRGDPAAYKPGVTREFYVADNDSGETWPVMTVGDESIRTDQGFVTARHFMRMPRRDGDRRRIDVWLAPSLGWLPVRLVQTEPNGTEFELRWRGPLTLPASNGTGADAAPDATQEPQEGTASPPPGGGASNETGNADLTGASDANRANGANGASEANVTGSANGAPRAAPPADTAPPAVATPGGGTTPGAATPNAPTPGTPPSSVPLSVPPPAPTITPGPAPVPSAAPAQPLSPAPATPPELPAPPASPAPTTSAAPANAQP